MLKTMKTPSLNPKRFKIKEITPIKIPQIILPLRVTGVIKLFLEK